MGELKKNLSTLFMVMTWNQLMMRVVKAETIIGFKWKLERCLREINLKGINRVQEWN